MVFYESVMLITQNCYARHVHFVDCLCFLLHLCKIYRLFCETVARTEICFPTLMWIRPGGFHTLCLLFVPLPNFNLGC